MNGNVKKPCPFCGGEPYAYTIQSGGFGSPERGVWKCKSCGAMGPECKLSWQDGLDLWNKRHSVESEAIELARTAIGAIETICGHAQFCDQCQSFEIAKQCREELHDSGCLNFLENVESEAISTDLLTKIRKAWREYNQMQSEWSYHLEEGGATDLTRPDVHMAWEKLNNLIVDNAEAGRIDGQGEKL